VSAASVPRAAASASVSRESVLAFARGTVHTERGVCAWTGPERVRAGSIGRLPGATVTDVPVVSEDGSLVAGRSDEAVIWTSATGLRPIRAVCSSSSGPSSTTVSSIE
jgi:hypothetical protein